MFAVDSPVGQLYIEFDEDAVTGLYFSGDALKATSTNVETGKVLFRIAKKPRCARPDFFPVPTVDFPKGEENPLGGKPSRPFLRADRGCLKPSPPNTVALQCAKELDEYFLGKRRIFTVPVRLEGTAFRRAVWEQLMQIPYGGTMSYGALAAAINSHKAARAVGGANHNNPISIIVPCHRVIGANGSLTGYGGGLWRKEWLLEHERKNL